MKTIGARLALAAMLLIVAVHAKTEMGCTCKGACTRTPSANYTWCETVEETCQYNEVRIGDALFRLSHFAVDSELLPLCGQTLGYWDKCSRDCESGCPDRSECAVPATGWKNADGIALACVCLYGNCLPAAQCLPAQPALIISVTDGGYCHRPGSIDCCQFMPGTLLQWSL